MLFLSLFLCFLVIPALIIVIIVRAIRKDDTSNLVKIFCGVFVLTMALFVFGGMNNEQGENGEVVTPPSSVSETEDAALDSPDEGQSNSAPIEESDPLLSNGFTEDEVAKINEVLANVGIVNYSIEKVTNNGRNMDIIIGRTSDDNNLQVNITLENKEVIAVFLSDISTQRHNAKITKKGKIKVVTENDKMSVDLYYDYEGGYLAVYHSDEGTITDYETGEVIVERNH